MALSSGVYTSVGTTQAVRIGANYTLGTPLGALHLKNLGPNRALVGTRSDSNTSAVTDTDGWPLEVGESIVLSEHRVQNSGDPRVGVSAAYGTTRIAWIIESEEA